MKKVLLFCIILLTSSCARLGLVETEEEQKVEPKRSIVNCTSQKNEQYTFFALDDEITSMQEIFYMSYDEAGISYEMDEQQVKEFINEKLSAKYSPIHGVNAIVDEVVDSQIKIIFMVDFEQADMDELVDAGLINKGEVQTQYVSLKKTRETYTQNGFACEIQ